KKPPSTSWPRRTACKARPWRPPWIPAPIRRTICMWRWCRSTIRPSRKRRRPAAIRSTPGPERPRPAARARPASWPQKDGVRSGRRRHSGLRLVFGLALACGRCHVFHVFFAQRLVHGLGGALQFADLGVAALGGERRAGGLLL